MIADLATTADVAALAAEIRALRATVESMASRLPSQWISLAEAADHMGVDPRTVTSMIERGEIIGRHAGRRWLVDASSLRPVDPVVVAAMAREARR